ncbi:hypothetical protein K2Z83_10100 [Oscillochloris sp. ZM17-4]|uniref:hypothetical protein n=1 Tax=Oscillochloris sp. ZM17-4 TaxID=2866714 RepID=UPI001C730524|nr:hypothetical protein [Oscillochloris sp. ZM17-4]MBX0328027.1 hypothetical protein [Oscillochloris sp. ZM17-4]
MARSNPHRRIIVTTFNTALATAAVTATAAGWAAFGMADASSAAAAAQPQPAVAQPIPSEQQLFSSRHHRDGHESFSFGGDDDNRFSQSQQQPALGNSAPSSGSFGQSQQQQTAPSSSFSQSIPQPRQPITRSRSSR